MTQVGGKLYFELEVALWHVAWCSSAVTGHGDNSFVLKRKPSDLASQSAMGSTAERAAPSQRFIYLMTSTGVFPTKTAEVTVTLRPHRRSLIAWATDCHCPSSPVALTAREKLKCASPALTRRTQNGGFLQNLVKWIQTTARRRHVKKWASDQDISSCREKQRLAVEVVNFLGRQKTPNLLVLFNLWVCFITILQTY